MNATLKELAEKWIAAKHAESEWNKRRIEIEERIVALTGKKDEGSQTVNEDVFKIVVTGKLTRKLDLEKWAAVRDEIPRNLWPIKIKEELDERGVKYLQQNEPEIYAMLPIEVKPAKTAVSVEVKA